jgi:hypothetical protein
MALTIEEIYSIKCTIARALFLGRPDWEDRIEVQLTSLQGAKDAYLRFRTASANVTIDSKDKIHIHCTDGRKPIKFVHESSLQRRGFANEVTSDRIATELFAHVGRSV